MKKIYLSLLTALISVFLSAQDAKSVFTNMPDSITPLLTAINRADFIDFLESNMKAEVKNKFDSISAMTDLTETFVRIKLTNQVNWQMKLLPLNDSKIICVITTACAPVCDSRIQFYTVDWRELPVEDYLNLPQENDFYIIPANQSDDKYVSLRKKADVFLASADLAKDSELLTFTYTTPHYINNEEEIELEKYIRQQLVFRWVDGKFVTYPPEYLQ